MVFPSAAYFSERAISKHKKDDPHGQTLSFLFFRLDFLS